MVLSLLWSLSMRPGTRSSEQSRKQAQRKANKRKQLRKLVSHSCASQPKSKAGGSCKGHWKNSSDVICPRRARLAQRRKKKKGCLQAGQASLVVGAHGELGSAAATPEGASTPPAWLWPQPPLHPLVALAAERCPHRCTQEAVTQHACARSLHTHHLHTWQAPTELTHPWHPSRVNGSPELPRACRSVPAPRGAVRAQPTLQWAVCTLWLCLAPPAFYEVFPSKRR